MRHLLLLLTAFLVPTLQAAPRTIQQFTQDWRFSQSDPADARSPTFDDQQWQTVTLPHDWAIAGPVSDDAPSHAAGGFFPTGIAWYRKTLTLASLPKGRLTYIVLDGIMANSDVYCNG